MSESERFTEQLQGWFGGKINRPSMDNMFKKTALPSLRELRYKNYVTDPDLKKILNSEVPNTIVNRTVLYLNDNTATSFGDMMASLIFGDNIIITCEKNDKAADVINTWNDNINMKHDSIEKFMKVSFKDNLINGEHLSRVYINLSPEKGDPKVDVQRVSLGTVKKEEHPTLGATRWIQRTTIPIVPLSKSKFYRRSASEPMAQRNVVTIIPNEINCCIHVSLFDYAPTSTILQQLNMKKWAYMFLRKFMEKYWAPFVVAYVGDLKNGYMPTNPEEMKENLQWAAAQIRMIRDFGGAAFPAYTKLEVLDTQVKKASVYLDTIDHLSKEIAIGLQSSISTRDSSGRAAQQQDIANEGWLRNIRSFRESYNIILRRFYAEVLLPAEGITGIKPQDLKITFPAIKSDSIKDILDAVEIAAKLGIFKDFKEIRKIINPIWKHVDDKISEADEKKMDATFKELNAPSRAEGDSPQARSGSAGAKPSTAKPKK